MNNTYYTGREPANDNQKYRPTAHGLDQPDERATRAELLRLREENAHLRALLRRIRAMTTSG